MESTQTLSVATAIEAAKRQKFHEVEKMALELLKSAPNDPEIYNLLGAAYASTGRPTLAIESIKQAHRLAPAAYSYARNLIRVLSNQKQFSEAMDVARAFVDAGHPKADELAEFAGRATGRVAPKANDVFEEIYRNNAWASGSGLGSTEEATRPYRAFLQQFIKANRIRSVVDLGCGDWQFARLIDWSGVRYVGLDVSGTALERARAIAPPSFEFRQFDAFNDSLPSADLLIAKDVLQHWPSREILRFLPKTECFQFCLITNGYAAAPNLNADIDLGNFRPLNLKAPPFNSTGANVFFFQSDDFKMTLLRMGKVNSTPE
jgi:SAM-dependent methyltransferase